MTVEFSFRRFVRVWWHTRFESCAPDRFYVDGIEECETESLWLLR